MVRSKNNADQRFINMYRVRNAYSRGVPIGFKGFDDKPDEDLTHIDCPPTGPIEPTIQTTTC